MCDPNMIKKLADEGYSWNDIAIKLQTTKPTVIYLKKKHNIKTNFKHSNDKTFNKVFEKGFVLLDDITTATTNKLHNFLCPKCNTQFSAIPSNLRRSTITSCGCVKLGLRKGGKYISGRRFAAIKNRYKKKHMEFTITVDYIEDLLEKQSFKCKLTGIVLNCDGYKKSFNASLDRIDSSIGYVKGNVQWVHKDINLMKNHFNEEYFKSMCSLVVNPLVN
jgi:predicted transcriptional regulator